MAETKEDEHKSENDADGGETGKKKTTEKTPEELQQIADDQRKRAEKAESDLKALKKANKEKEDADKPEDANKEKPNAQTSDPVEVAKLANALNGLSDEAITQLTLVAKAKGISLAEAKSDPLFTAWHDQVQEAAKKEKAKRGAARGSSQGEEDKAVEGLAPDIHKPLDEQRQTHMDAVKKLMSK